MLEIVARTSRSGLAVWPCWGTGAVGAALTPGDKEAMPKGPDGVIPHTVACTFCLTASTATSPNCCGFKQLFGVAGLVQEGVVRLVRQGPLHT